MAVTDEIPKSRITLTYRTNVQGQPKDVQLPFRVLVMGDLSGGTSVDRRQDLDKRQIRNLDGRNLDQAMKDMQMSISFSVPNRIDPENTEEVAVTLPIESMKSFTPAAVAHNIPKVRALLLLRKLLLEVQGNLDNRKDFRRMLRQLAQDPAAVQAMMKELEGFESFRLPAKAGPDANGSTMSTVVEGLSGAAETKPADTKPAG